MKYFIFVIFFLHCVLLTRSQVGSALPLNGMKEFGQCINSNFGLNRNVIDQDLSGNIEIEYRVSEKDVLNSFYIIKDIGQFVGADLILTVKDRGYRKPASINDNNVIEWVSLSDNALARSESASSDTIVARPVEDIEIFRVKFLKNFRYPEKAINAGIRGVYSLEFTVNENSKLSGIKLIPNHGYDIEEAAIRALGRAGKWSPAMVNGIPIKSKQKFEFTLNLNEFRRGVM